MPTRNRLRAALFSRVPGISALEIISNTNAPSTIFVIPKEGGNVDNIREQIKNAMYHVAPGGMPYHIVVADQLPTNLGQTNPHLTGSHYLASLAPDPTTSGIKETMMRLVPKIGRIDVSSPRPGVLHLMVEDFDGNANPAFLDEARDAFSAVSTIGITWEVGPWKQTSTALTPPPSSRRARKAKMVSLSEANEKLFADRIRQLTTTDTIAPIHLVDEARGTQVLYIPGPPDENPGLGAFLTLYDRVFVLMLSTKVQNSEDFEHIHGIPYSQFLQFVRSGRVVPVFRNRLESYNEYICRPIVDDLSLQYLSSRDLDYLAARYAWTSSPFLIPTLRKEQAITQSLFEVMHAISLKKGTKNRQMQALANVLDSALASAESFEGLLWRRGFLCLGEMGPGVAMTHAFRAAAMQSSLLDQGQKDTVAIEAYLASTNVALAQSMNASLSQGILLNDLIIETIASAFLPKDSSVPAVGHTKKLAQIISSLSLSYSNDIPPDEYLDLFDRAETQRIRSVAAALLGDSEGDRDNEGELRERIARLNSEVAKIAKNAIETSDIDVLGDIAKTTVPSAGAQFVAGILELVGLPTIRRALALTADILIEDTSMGSVVDKIRGGLNNVSSHAIRLYRVRKKLSALRRG